jgi:hypothetical protein
MRSRTVQTAANLKESFFRWLTKKYFYYNIELLRMLQLLYLLPYAVYLLKLRGLVQGAYQTFTSTHHGCNARRRSDRDVRVR